jgi:hypothetical protein
MHVVKLSYLRSQESGPVVRKQRVGAPPRPVSRRTSTAVMSPASPFWSHLSNITLGEGLFWLQINMAYAMKEDASFPAASGSSSVTARTVWKPLQHSYHFVCSRACHALRAQLTKFNAECVDCYAFFAHSAQNERIRGRSRVLRSHVSSLKTLDGFRLNSAVRLYINNCLMFLIWFISVVYKLCFT